MSKEFACYGADCVKKGGDVLFESAQAFVHDGVSGEVTNTTCNINDFMKERGTDEWCSCPFKNAKCPSQPDLSENQGGPGDIIAAPFFLSGALSLIATVIFLYVLTLKPLQKMKEMNEEEVGKWEKDHDIKTI